MIKTIGFCVKQDHLSHEEFVERFRERHVELGKQLPGIRKYTTSVPTETAESIAHRPGGSRDVSVPDWDINDFDIVSEIWFEDGEVYNNAFNSDASKRAFEDEDEFIEEIYFVAVDVTKHLDD